ncbi:MAG: DNA topoisomerase, partial [Eubacteriales bacterium]
QTYFAYDEKEKSDIIAGLGNAKYSIQRSKGLGENEPEMMSLTTMSPATRRLILVTPDDAEATADMFDLLPGDNLAGRKEYIAQNGADWLELADIF